MKKIRIKDLVDFRRKSERSKKTFAFKLKQDEKVNESSGGGDYWVSCLSAIGNVVKYNDTEFLDEKIDLLAEKIRISELERIKTQFQRNIDILIKFQEFDFKNLIPNTELNFLKKPKDKSVIDVKGFPIQVIPSHVFSFSQNGSDEIGAVWFISKLGGLKKSELGMFTEILYKYLDKHYSNDFYINPTYCIAIDVFDVQQVSFEELQKDSIPSLIEKTIDEIRNS